MPIPFYEDLFFPVLQIIFTSEYQRIKTEKLHERIAKRFHVFSKLNADQSHECERKLKKTVGRATKYLYEAGLIYVPEQWRLGLTPTGLAVVKKHPPKIDHEYLFQFQVNKEWGAEFLKLKDFIDTLQETITSKEFDEIYEERFKPIAHLLFGQPKFKRDVHEYVCNSRMELGYIIIARGKEIYDPKFIQSFYPYGMKRLSAIEEEIEKEKEKMEGTETSSKCNTY